MRLSPRLLAGGSILSGLLLLCASACSPPVTTASERTALELTARNNQAAEVGSALPMIVVLKASDSRGPMANIAITVTPGNQSGSIAPSSLTTGTDGTVQFTWTLGTKPGPQTLA